MKKEPEYCEVSKEQKAVIELARRQQLEGRHPSKFYYESNRNNKIRKVTKVTEFSVLT